MIRQPRHTPIGQGELQALYGLWLAAFTLKLIGSSWDVAWHFRYLRDDLAPPHIINSLGTVLALLLLLAQSYRGLAADRRGLRLAQLGAATFLIAIPLDLINHRIFGLDITTWSPTHALLYIGTGMLLSGVLWSWLAVAPLGRVRTLFALALGAFLLEDVLFPLGQQEFGVFSIDAFLRGQPTADRELLAFCGGNLPAFVTGSIPTWLYPLWLILGSSVVLLALRRILALRWTASIVSMVYLAYRVAALAALSAAGFPPSFIPFMLLAAALLIDLAATLRWSKLLTSLAVVGGFYGGAALLAQLTLMPSFPLTVAPLIVIMLWLVLWLSRRSKLENRRWRIEDRRWRIED